MPHGLLIGHWTDAGRGTGCTVFLPPAGSVCAAEVRGQASGTREIAALDPGGAAERAHAIVLAGGSAFGLGAADGVARALHARGVGVDTGVARVPIVASAVIFDLPLGSVAWPDGEAGVAALDAAGPWEAAARGTVGVGTGATVSGLAGRAAVTKGGFGRATRTLPGGATVAAWAVANTAGDVLDEHGVPLRAPAAAGEPGSEEAVLRDPPPGLSFATTLVVVATDARLDKRATWRLARAAHGGVARATAPAATSLDGDTAFAIATGAVVEPSFLALETAAAACAAGAIRDAVRSAGTLHGCPSFSEA